MLNLFTLENTYQKGKHFELNWLVDSGDKMGTYIVELDDVMTEMIVSIRFDIRSRLEYECGKPNN